MLESVFVTKKMILVVKIEQNVINLQRVVILHFLS